jgi:hypothetical protein
LPIPPSTKERDELNQEYKQIETQDDQLNKELDQVETILDSFKTSSKK